MQNNKITLKKFPKDFRVYFFLGLTRELIKHSYTGEINELKNIVKEEIKEKKEEIKEQKQKIKEIVKKKEKPILTEKLPEKKSILPPIPIPTPKKVEPRILKIPEPKLPQNFQYLIPTPTQREIDLEKLNPLIKDPAVNIIECNGSDEKVIVRGKMGVKPTGIILNKKEIDKVIKTFSEKSKIPIHEGVFRVVVGRLILSAIISEVTGSKFIIKKMFYSPNMQPAKNLKAQNYFPRHG